MTTKTITKTIRLGERLNWEKSDYNLQPTAGIRTKTLVVTRSRTGSGVPNWKAKIQNQQNASSNLTGQYETFSSTGPGLTKVTFEKDALGFWGNSQGRPASTYYNQAVYDPAAWEQPSRNHAMLFNWGSTADGRASNQYLSAIRQKYTEFSSGSFFGEFKQTLQMIRSPGEALTRSIKDYMKSLNKAKRLYKHDWHKAIPGLWLEQSFGWKPLMMDIQNAFDAANSLLEQEHVVRIKGSGKDQKMVAQSSYQSSPDGQGFSSNIIQHVNYRTVETDMVRYYGAIRVRAATTSSERWARFGFTPDDFLPTAWEILPWSFLADYFASIGDFIGGLCTRTSDVYFTSKVQRKESLMALNASPDLNVTPPAYSNMQMVASHSANFIWKRTDIVRSASVGVPTPSLYLKTNGLSYGQLANISALFGQACQNLQKQHWSGRNYRL